MEFETPGHLVGRLRIGREEFCQRLLTSLILHAPYPRWNLRSVVSPQGLAFLRVLHEMSFGSHWPTGDPLFVDEFELPARSDIEKGGAPDYAVLWEDHIWLIELKTERASHRREQIPGYFEFAHHYYPGAAIDLTYLTPPMEYTFRPPGPWARFAHVTWQEVGPLIKEIWSHSVDPGEQEVVSGLLAAIDMLAETPSVWRSTFPRTPVYEPDIAWREALAQGLRLAEQTAEDGKQRAVEYTPADLEDLLALRLELRTSLASPPPGSPIRRVMPWLWRPESTGEPMTVGGKETGMEIRLSRYDMAVH